MTINPVYNALVEAAQKWPNSFAIHDSGRSITFKELYDDVEIIRKELIELGLKQGLGVGVMSRNSSDFIKMIFAVIGTGAAVMPMSHQLKAAEINDILKEAQLHVILDDQSGANPNTFESQQKNLKSIDFRLLQTNQPTSRVFAAHVESPAFMRFTSGTTGKSKGVVISHDSAIERVIAANKALKLGPDDTVIWVLPMAYHFVVSILLYINFGTAIAIVKDFLAQNIFETVNRHNGTMLYASPMQIRLLSRFPGRELMPSMKLVISTSAGISNTTCEAFKKRFSISVSQAYGIIEIGLPIININNSDSNPESVGFALPDYDVEILNDKYQVVAPNEIGYLGIRGPGMFDAYLTPPQSRIESLNNGFFLTADYASKSEDGLITIEGRAKAVINISGNKVFPEEVEQVLETYKGIKTAKIYSQPHSLMGQIVQADIILNSDSTIDTEEVLTYCRKRLSTFKIPQKLFIVDKIEMTPTGKIKRT